MEGLITCQSKRRGVSTAKQRIFTHNLLCFLNAYLLKFVTCCCPQDTCLRCGIAWNEPNQQCLGFPTYSSTLGEDRQALTVMHARKRDAIAGWH